MSKVWFGTGATRGLGRAFTEATLEAGDRVVARARNPEQLVELKGRYSGNHTAALDVTDEAQAKARNALVTYFQHRQAFCAAALADYTVAR